MSLPYNKSDSDSSSDTSWTIINESAAASRNNSSENICMDAKQDKVTKELLEKTWDTDPEMQLLEKSTKPTTVLKNKKKKSKSDKKKNTDYMSLLSIFACLLTITGLTLLTTFLPSGYIETTNIENMHNHLVETQRNLNNPSQENAINSIYDTIDVMETANSMDVLKMMSQNLSDEEICEAISPKYYNNSLVPENIKIKIITPYTNQVFDAFDEDIQKSFEPTDIRESLQNNTKSLIEKAKDLIKNPTLQMFVATVLQDLCLIKLISEFSKRTREEESTKNATNSESVTKPVKNSKKTKPKTKKSEGAKPKDKKSKKNKKTKPVTALLSENQQLKKINSTTSVVPNKENGKSECERRFEELDSKWSFLGENHRQKIQEIKNKFQSEIFQIKEQEKEGFGRAQKIQFLREKFIQRLRTDREIYLYRLRKLREEKQHVLREICHNSKNDRSFSAKDVSVGNFGISLPSDYNFADKLKEIQQKEKAANNSNLKATNNESFSYVPTIEEHLSNTNMPGINSATKINVDNEPKEKDNHSENYYDMNKKYNSRKRARSMKKKQAKKDAREVQNVIANIVNTLSEATSNTLNKTSSQAESLPSYAQLDIPDVAEDVPTIQRREADKRSLLYDAAFENQSKRIRQNDIIKWNTKFGEFKWKAPMELMTKQDNLKSHKQKIIYKGVL